MADDRNQRGPRDASRINLSEDYEVRYWTEALGVSEDELRIAVQAAGSSTKAVREHLAKR